MENDGYIDIDDALKRVGGNMGLYKKLLGSFIKGDYLNLLSEAYESGNMEEAAHLAHTLKGVSANLSLSKVASLATTLDQLMKNGEDSVACFEELKQAYGVTDAKITEILSQ